MLNTKCNLIFSVQIIAPDVCVCVCVCVCVYIYTHTQDAIIYTENIKLHLMLSMGVEIL